MYLFEQTVKIDDEDLKNLTYWLTDNTDSTDRLNERETYVRTVKFADGFQMDVKCCGTREGTAWTEAVLFYDNGQEACHTEVSDEYLGDWEIEWGGAVYRVHVIHENKQGDSK